VRIRDQRLAGVIELTALYAAPIWFALAYADAFRGGQGLLLGLLALGVGLGTWAAVTFAIEHRLRGSATAGRATARGLILGLVAGLATLVVILVVSHPASLLFPLLVAVYVDTIVAALLRQRPATA
jgi:hypothetical protein